VIELLPGALSEFDMDTNEWREGAERMKTYKRKLGGPEKSEKFESNNKIQIK
jgi:hypothetical protein